MSVHEQLVKDKAYHFIEQEHKGIKYMYASNIQEDNILAIIKHTMPLDIEKAFADVLSCWDALYIWCGKDSTGYFLIISLAESKNYNFSHKEIIRICGTSVSYLLHEYFGVKDTGTYKGKMLRGIFGSAFEIPIYRSEKN